MLRIGFAHLFVNKVETEKGRVAYGPVTVSDVASLFDAGFVKGNAHRLSLGLTDEIPYLKNQERLTFARAGKTRPLSLDDYAATGGWAAGATLGSESIREIARARRMKNPSAVGAQAAPAGAQA